MNLGVYVHLRDETLDDMVKRAKAVIRVSIWVDHGGAEYVLTSLYWRSLAQVKFSEMTFGADHAWIPL